MTTLWPRRSSLQGLALPYRGHGPFPLFKAELINRSGPWTSKKHVEWEPLQWADWFNRERLLEPLGYITPIETQETYHQALKSNKIAA